MERSMLHKGQNKKAPQTESGFVHTSQTKNAGVLVYYLQDSWKQVSKVLQQCRVAFIWQNKGRCSPGRQGTNLPDIWKKIKYDLMGLSNREMTHQKSTLVRSYLWVCLVLHALDKHALDNLHIMLLLVAEDSWEVPIDAKMNKTVSQ